MCLCFWLKEKTVFPLQLVHYNPTMWAKCSEGPVKPQYLHQITTAGTLLWAQEQAGLFVSAVPVPHPMCSKLTPPKHSKSPQMAPLYFPMQKQIFWCPVKKKKTKEKKKSFIFFCKFSFSFKQKVAGIFTERQRWRLWTTAGHSLSSLLPGPLLGSSSCVGQTSQAAQCITQPPRGMDFSRCGELSDRRRRKGSSWTILALASAPSWLTNSTHLRNLSPAATTLLSNTEF